MERQTNLGPSAGGASAWDAFDADAVALFAALAPVADASVLGRIASADNGAGAEAIRQLLRQLLRTGRLPAPMEWVPREALTLSRSADPEQDEREAKEQARAHAARALACAALLREHAEPLNADDPPGDELDLPRLCMSALVLGKPVIVGARRFCAWMIGQPAFEAWRSSAAVAAVLVSAEDRTLDDERWGAAADAALALAAASRFPRADRFGSSAGLAMLQEDARSLWLPFVRAALGKGCKRPADRAGNLRALLLPSGG